MRQEKDGDIVPKKEDMIVAHELLDNIINLVGDTNEHTNRLKNDIEQLKKEIDQTNS